ncbi:MAG: prolyl oligopeptidase family serine peptidase [Acidobacteria bacterium]|nr:prolyl oligopeptidase family serine peptidase [Acidobacteriota bacterium]
MASTAPVRKPFWSYWKVLRPSLILLAAALLTFLVTLSYRVIYPQAEGEMGTPESYLLPYQDLSFAGPDGNHSLWFIPGLKGAPAIFLNHDYNSSRVALLNLATLLREAGYNVCLITFRGHEGSSFSRSTLGIRESEDLIRGIDFALKNLPVHESRVGIWGVSLGAHVALRAALKDNRVRVLILDSPYPSVFDFIKYQVGQRLVFESAPLAGVVTGFFSLYCWISPSQVTEVLDVKPLFPVRTLYLTGLETPSFARWTRQLYAQAEGRKDILLLPRSRKSILLTGELKNYDGRILDYFKRHLAP